MWWLWGLAAWQAVTLLGEYAERRQVYGEARAYAEARGKPLLVVGTRNLPAWHPCGDVSLDIDPEASGNRCENTVIADVRDIPYPSSYFGAAFLSHVLEHLDTPEDAAAALTETSRVADRVFVVSPSRFSPYAWIAPGHHLWIEERDGLFLMERRGITGKGV